MTDPGAVARLVEQVVRDMRDYARGTFNGGLSARASQWADELEAALAADRGAGPSEAQGEHMTLEEFQRVGRGMVAAARARYREAALRLCYSDEEQRKALALETAIGEVSPEEAVLALTRWLDEHRAALAPLPRAEPQEEARPYPWLWCQCGHHLDRHDGPCTLCGPEKCSAWRKEGKARAEGAPAPEER